MTRRALLVCCAPQVLVALDFSLTAVAAPVAVEDLAPGTGPAWLFSGYSLTLGALLLPAGRLADRAGRRRVMRAGLGLTAAGGLLAALAGSMAVLVGGRVLAGAGAALMTPAALALLSGGTRDGEERRQALSLYGTAVAAGFVCGALAGGLLASVATWRPLFVVEALGALLALTATAMLAPDRAERRPRGSGGELSGRLARACLAGATVTATGVGATVLLAGYLQDDLALSPAGAGLCLAVFGIPALRAARWIRRAPARTVAWLGLALQGIAFLVLAAAAATASLPGILAGMLAFGLAHVIANGGVAIAATRGVAAAHGSVMGVLTTAQYLGGAVGPLVLRGEPAATLAAAGAAACIVAAVTATLEAGAGAET